MLAGDTHHMGCQSAQHLKCGRGIVDKYLVSSFAENDSFYFEITVKSNIPFLQQMTQFRVVGKNKVCFNRCFLGTCANLVCGRSCSQNKIDGIYNDGFAGTRFAGKCIKAVF